MSVGKKLILVLLVLFLILLLPVVLAENSDYYADLSIDVREDGYVRFFGETNYESFNNVQTAAYTSKKGEVWTLEIDTAKDNFSDYYFELTLPDRAIINYLKVSNVNIDTSESRIRITGYDEDAPLKIVIQYKIGPKRFITTNNIIITGFVLLLVLGLILALLKRNPSTSVKKEELHFTNDRQEKIYDYLRNHGKVTQKELENNLDMPKSSLSRNIESLYKKGYIDKKRQGMSNVLEIKRV